MSNDTVSDKSNRAGRSEAQPAGSTEAQSEGQTVAVTYAGRRGMLSRLCVWSINRPEHFGALVASLKSHVNNSLSPNISSTLTPSVIRAVLNEASVAPRTKVCITCSTTGSIVNFLLLALVTWLKSQGRLSGGTEGSQHKDRLSSTVAETLGGKDIAFLSTSWLTCNTRGFHSGR